MPGLESISVSDNWFLVVVVAVVVWILRGLAEDYFFDFLKRHINKVPPAIKNRIAERSRKRNTSFQVEVLMLQEDEVMLSHYHNRLIWAQTEIIIDVLMIMLFGGLIYLMKNLIVDLIGLSVIAVSLFRFMEHQTLAYYLRDVIRETRHQRLKAVGADLAAIIQRRIEQGLTKQDRTDTDLPPENWLLLTLRATKRKFAIVKQKRDGRTALSHITRLPG